MKKSTTKGVAMSDMTGYRVAKLANAELEKVGLKPIPTQMAYQYIAKGLIPSHVVNGQNLVTDVNACKWVARYVANRAEKSSKEFRGIVAGAEFAADFS